MDNKALTLRTALPDLTSIGSDVCISHHINIQFPFPPKFTFKDFLVVYLKNGTLTGKMNGMKQSYSAPCMITLSDSNVYEFMSASNDVNATVFSFSAAFTAQLNIVNRFELNKMFVQNPALSLNKECISLLEEFIDRLMKLSEKPQNPYLNDALLHLVLYFFYGIGCYYYQASSHDTHSWQVANDFFQLIEQYGMEKRNIDFYADKLHLSPKYVQSLIKKTTGKSAYSYIEGALLKEAKRLLATNKHTIQQIAMQLKFCDQSYFGAFFKRMTGMPPKKYREQVLESNQ